MNRLTIIPSMQKVHLYVSLMIHLSVTPQRRHVRPYVRYIPSVHHTNITTSPSVCPSKQSSDCHTMSKTSQSICQSHILSVCHNVIPTSPSVCQSRDSSVCYLTRDAIFPTVWQTICLSSVMSVLGKNAYKYSRMKFPA